MPDKALYVGEAGTALGDGTELVSGVTVAEISRGEAEASNRWKPLSSSKASKAEAKQGES